MTLSLVGLKTKSARLLFKINTQVLFDKFLNGTYDLQSFFHTTHRNQILMGSVKVMEFRLSN